MKLSILLMVIGTGLAVDGTIRFISGIVNYYPLLSVGGVLTGWLLGGYLLIKGIRRFKAVRNDIT